jgi:CorA-like Mg2+ transporter protein
MGSTYFLDGDKSREPEQLHCRLEPFLGVYDDFGEPPPFSQGFHDPELPLGTGMCTDLVRYWTGCLPPGFDPVNPPLQSLAYYALRIVAAEWVKYVAVMDYCLKQNEYQDGRGFKLETLDSILKELQSWRRRSMSSQHKINSIIRVLRSRRSTGSADSSCLQTLITDYEYIYSNIEAIGHRLESMIPVVTSMVQIVDARQSFIETSNINRLTILALVFIPLSYISNLFSMNPTIAPGGSHFWVYLVVAIPITLLVLIIARPPLPEIRKVYAWFGNLRISPLYISRLTTKRARPKDALA